MTTFNCTYCNLGRFETDQQIIGEDRIDLNIKPPEGWKVITTSAGLRFQCPLCVRDRAVTSMLIAVNEIGEKVKGDPGMFRDFDIVGMRMNAKALLDACDRECDRRGIPESERK